LFDIFFFFFFFLILWFRSDKLIGVSNI
jgi:hypothetical protein